MTPPTRRELAQLLSDVTTGDIRVDEALAEGVPLRDMGMNSLGLLRLLDVLELRYGVELDTGDGGLQNATLDALLDRITAATAQPGERYRAGQTALLATVEEAEPLVEHWRRRFDPAASAGVPAHVTVLFPFLDLDRITETVVGDLRTLIGARSPFTIRFEECRRFPEVLYLAPTPDHPFRALTESIAKRWPEAPPYEGKFTEVIPHLTIADGQPRIFEELEAELSDQLPITATISSVGLFVNDGHRWRHHLDFPMLG